ncbi:toprim domain-containing protein [Nonomuraea sp. NPDC003560]|uniref:toprim domain-containing protein n=1 Tax=Nonomuraea sp. NPDC003560 TaxID=3364341 RepID=UPI003684D60A
MSAALAAVLQRLYEVTGHVPRGSGTNRSARCPAHDDRNPSLSVGLGRDGAVVLRCHGGPQCPVEDIVAALDLSMSALWPPDQQRTRDRLTGPDMWMPCGHDKVAEYLYRDEQGAVLYGVARCARKGKGCQGFRQWRPDASAKSGRRWSLNDGGRIAVRLVPYRLPEVLAAVRDERVVMICEGEKDVEALSARPGITATCNPMGAGKWRPEFAEHFHGADVSIVADRDEAGRRHAQAVVDHLTPVARSIYVIQAHHGKDAADHLAAGGHTGDFLDVWAPKPYHLESCT